MFLKNNADNFLENARMIFEKKIFNLSAFNIEQAIQLYLKFLLDEKAGYFPKTHSLKVLFKEATKIFPEIKQIYEQNINLISDIESAYITSRYYDISFDEIQVKNMLEFAYRFRDITIELWQRR